MYVYLTTDGRTTDLSTSVSKEDCHTDKGFRLLLVLEVPEHLVSTILLKWKRESRGPISRVNKGLKIAKKYLLRLYVADEELGELGELQKFKAEPGKAKPIPPSFWENL